jgi:hypothetical protein
MDEATESIARRMLVTQAIALIKQGVEQIGEMPRTDDLAVLAAIANVAHRLSLNEVLRDARNLGHEFYLDQMAIIMRRIQVEAMIVDYVGGNRSDELILQYVRRALSPHEQAD